MPAVTVSAIAVTALSLLPDKIRDNEEEITRLSATGIFPYTPVSPVKSPVSMYEAIRCG